MLTGGLAGRKIQNKKRKDASRKKRHEVLDARNKVNSDTVRIKGAKHRRLEGNTLSDRIAKQTCQFRGTQAVILIAEAQGGDIFFRRGKKRDDPKQGKGGGDHK